MLKCLLYTYSHVSGTVDHGVSNHFEQALACFHAVPAKVFLVSATSLFPQQAGSKTRVGKSEGFARAEIERSECQGGFRKGLGPCQYFWALSAFPGPLVLCWVLC